MVNVKGLWIPVELFFDEELNMSEVITYSLVLFLSSNNQKCFFTNYYLSKILKVTIKHASRVVNSLKNKKYIDIKFYYKDKSKEIINRELIPIKKYGSSGNNKIANITKTTKGFSNNNYSKEDLLALYDN
ncbi:MAG: hypothetical protein IJ880_15580 [Bacilli bacterium]|nr:hypothetical protein [Bacilli bacterium]